MGRTVRFILVLLFTSGAVSALAPVPAIAASSPDPAAVHSVTDRVVPVLAQYSDSSRTTRIPRGLIKLGLYLIIAAIGGVIWLVRKITGQDS